MEEFGVGNVAASLELVMYVFAYMSKTGWMIQNTFAYARSDGIDPMLFSPLSK